MLRELLEGHNNRSFARKLGISEHAVHYHINNTLYNNEDLAHLDAIIEGVMHL